MPELAHSAALPQPDELIAAPGEEVSGPPVAAIRNALIERREDGQITRWNAAAVALLGWREQYALGRNLEELDLAALDGVGDEARALGMGRRVDREMLLRCADGHYVAVLAQVTSSPEGSAGSVVYVLWDRTYRLLGAQQVHASPDQLELVQYSSDVVALLDRDGVMSLVSSPILRDAGYVDDELVGACAFDFVHPDDFAGVRSNFTAMVDEGLPWCSLTFRFRTPAGQFLWLEGRAINLLRRSTLRSVLLALHDVTHRVEVESGLAHRATHDALTDLPNRVLFLDRLNHILEHVRRSDELAAVLFWDIDRFKAVNDSAGHAVGDSLLIEVARRAVAAMRAEDTVARIGGDEFVGCAAVSSLEQVSALAERLRDALVIEVTLARGDRIQVTASVGVAVGTAVAAERLVAEADRAMYDARRPGGRGISIVSVEAD